MSKVASDIKRLLGEPETVAVEKTAGDTSEDIRRTEEAVELFVKRLFRRPEKSERIGGCMNEKVNFYIVVILVIVAVAFGGAGYYAGYRLSVRQAGQSDNEIREQLEIKQARIDELETRLADVGIVVSDVVGDISGAVGRISGHIDIAVESSGDIRITTRELREAVKILEDGKRYFRELAARLSGGELDFEQISP
jgi:hypothetical protein